MRDLSDQLNIHQKKVFDVFIHISISTCLATSPGLKYCEVVYILPEIVFVILKQQSMVLFMHDTFKFLVIVYIVSNVLVYFQVLSLI